MTTQLLIVATLSRYKLSILVKYLTHILRLPHDFLFTMKICIKSLIISSIYANGVVTFDVGPTLP